MNSMIEKIIRKVLQNAATTAVDKAIAARARKVAQADGRQWNGNFHCMVSGYYEGLAMQYIGTVFIIIGIFCLIGMWAAGEGVFWWCFLAVMIVFLIAVIRTKRRMRVIVYWEGGIMFLDRKGNEIAQIPSCALNQAVIKYNKIIIPWEEKKYIIYRNAEDNEQDVQKMLAFYGLG